MKTAHVDPVFWKGKNVFLTGHTGFKGSWLSLWLSSMGAKVTGYSLAPNTTPNLFEVLAIDCLIEKSHIADISNLEGLQKTMSEAKPDVVIHMAAQPLVRYSYVNPVETYATNVMGTVHVLECTRTIDSVRATVVVTTDKCYENKEWLWGYRENEPMGGFDPYSNSKGCAELVTSAYRQSYFSDSNSTNKIASARAGNVIGGGDWSEDRLIPDAIKAFEANKPLMIRNPLATRPWQHVLEPLSGYLILAQALYEQGSSFASGWNFGPRDEDTRAVQEVVDLLISGWGNSARWEKEGSEQPHEANLLKLDCSKARTQLGWIPQWNLETATQKIVEWQKAYQVKENMQELSLAQINHYMSAK
ncbi:MAG: CDP-glucose 4,6-dehydratase [Polynucleobacter sp. 24-46-87]|jgi:CDP-glucose 4,6-dehydratase|uniref:CDP-glucose 4,6-dehydratase n=1 Tax=unclassified Polynucleobacter TaxID=2640945 RepID=UPI000BD34796|nr:MULTISPECIES: CDP-glucose 4,6-dehydratase [unclassified Polynucleobacter]OYY21104.1 MAG: CDP-glucose 4,6-dehydratase [Polynucleobacter sp. 35-46-11]OZA15998.1 MAG: CDP-glucose 4,6-dehydratase [Polynucleobacter sp. 24-46-87]OZA78295.1 MAG: CDP-glucose 4,6-dehydratase [Polynucleobacter sp. 39-46-10]